MLHPTVGGHPEGSGSEETHRHANLRIGPIDLRLGAVLGVSHACWQWIKSAAHTRRFRLQAAGLIALAGILTLLVAIPARSVRITADGGVTEVSSRNTSDHAIVEQAGIEIEPGDEIETGADDMLVVQRATEVRLDVDGTTLALRSQADSIDELLAEAGVTLDTDDSVYRNDAYVPTDAPVAPPAPQAVLRDGPTGLSRVPEPVALEVRRAVPFTVVENGQQLQLSSSRETIGAALRDVGVRLGPGDEIQPPPSTELTAALQVHVDHAAPIVVTLPERKTIIYTVADNVGDALATGPIDLPAEYRLEPAAGTPISAGITVRVVALSSEQELETVRIESFTRYEPDPDLPPGTTQVVPGQDGVLYRQYAVEYQNDEVVSRELAAEWYDPEPADTIVYYSTAEPPTPTPPPAPAPVAAPPAPGPSVGTGSARWADIVCSYSWDCDWALAVIACESGGNPNAYNPAGYVGLFQIWEGYGSNLTDPATNIAAAWSLYTSGGRSHWPNCP